MLQQKNDKLQKNIDHIKTFFNSIIHELRSPTDQVKFKVNESLEELQNIKNNYNRQIMEQNQL